MVAGLQFPKLTSLEETINCSTEEARSIATFDVNGLKATLSNVKPSGALGLKLAGRNWHISHARPSRDTEVQWRTRWTTGEMTVTQFVPKANWFLAPSPTIKLKQHRTFSQRGKHDVDTAFVVERNTLMARTRLNGAIYSGPDRAYKAVVNLDTVTGSTLTARAKVRHPVLHSVSASVNVRTGPVLAAKSKPCNGLKVKAAFDQHRNTALASLSYEVPKDGKHTVLNADIAMPVNNVKATPHLVLGIKWNF